MSQLVDDAIQACPIDVRRALYGNIVLSGGSMQFKNLRTCVRAEGAEGGVGGIHNIRTEEYLCS